MNDAAMTFRTAYAAHRAGEGRGLHGAAMRSLPYLRHGPLARQWRVRAKSFDAFQRHVLAPMAARAGRTLDILDLGAGNGWLSYRLARAGHRATAVDIREDEIDGLGAAAELQREAVFSCLTASFEALPLPDRQMDIAVFNAALHYAQDLSGVLGEAARVTRGGGMLVILDSPFYDRDADGDAMVAEKRARGAQRFGARADVLLSQGFIEYLTPARLAAATPCLAWSRRRVTYPLWYELRPLMARLKGARAPSRFDLWTAAVP